MQPLARRLWRPGTPGWCPRARCAWSRTRAARRGADRGARWSAACGRSPPPRRPRGSSRRSPTPRSACRRTVAARRGRWSTRSGGARARCSGQRAVHRRRDEPDVAVATGELLVAAHHRVVRGGLQRAGGAATSSVTASRTPRENPPRQTAGDLGGTDDPGRLGRRLVTVLVGELRRPADAPGVEQPLAGVAVHHHDAVHGEGEEPLALHEEGPPLARRRSRRR